MPTLFSSLVSFLKDAAPGLLTTFGKPASPGIGDTDWGGVNATGAAVNEAFNMTNGQILMGKTGDAGLSNPTTAPALTTSTTGGTLLAGVYEVVRTYNNTYGETQPSSTGTITIPAGTSTNKINVAAITLPAGALSQSVYVSDAAGSLTMRFSVTTSGGAFSITSLPVGGAATPPTSNTTGSDNHAVKATIATTNGLVVTNGPGSIDISLSNAGDLTSAGTAITVAKVNGVAVTGTPATGDVLTATGTSAAHWAAPTGGGSTALTSAHIYVGNGSNVATDVAMSGDTTISSTGAVTVGKVNGIAVTGTPAIGNVITATSTTAAHWAAPTGGGSGISSGTSFPGSPATNDLFYRTDRNLLYFFNGAAWLTTTLYKHQLVFSVGTTDPITTTGSVPLRAGAMDSDFSVYIEKAFAPFDMSNTPYDASNFWSGKLFYVGTTSGTATQLGTTQTTWATGRTAGPRYIITFTLGITHTITDQGLYYIEYDKTNSPAGLFPDTGVIQYRLVG